MTVNNFELIRSLLDFSDENYFYFVQVIQRKKDHKESNRRLGRNNSARLIKAFYINTEQKWEEYKEEMIQLSELFNARVGINLNKRNYKAVALEMMEQLAHCIKSENYNVSKLYNSVCGQVKSGDKTWIIDIDNKDIHFVEHVVNSLEHIEPFNVIKPIALVPTRSGYHIITRPFNSQEFGRVFPELEVHKNNPTCLYIP